MTEETSVVRSLRELSSRGRTVVRAAGVDWTLKQTAAGYHASAWIGSEFIEVDLETSEMVQTALASKVEEVRAGFHRFEG